MELSIYCIMLWSMAVWMDRRQSTLAGELDARGTDLSGDRFEGLLPQRDFTPTAHTSAINKAANLSKRLADKPVLLATETALQGCPNETTPQDMFVVGKPLNCPWVKTDFYWPLIINHAVTSSSHHSRGARPTGQRKQRKRWQNHSVDVVAKPGDKLINLKMRAKSPNWCCSKSYVFSRCFRLGLIPKKRVWDDPVIGLITLTR